jgi:hypothetical protein
MRAGRAGHEGGPGAADMDIAPISGRVWKDILGGYSDDVCHRPRWRRGARYPEGHAENARRRGLGGSGAVGGGVAARLACGRGRRFAPIAWAAPDLSWSSVRDGPHRCGRCAAATARTARCWVGRRAGCCAAAPPAAQDGSGKRQPPALPPTLCPDLSTDFSGESEPSVGGCVPRSPPNRPWHLATRKGVTAAPHR